MGACKRRATMVRNRSMMTNTIYHVHWFTPYKHIVRWYSSTLYLLMHAMLHLELYWDLRPWISSWPRHDTISQWRTPDSDWYSRSRPSTEYEHQQLSIWSLRGRGNNQVVIVWLPRYILTSTSKSGSGQKHDKACLGQTKVNAPQPYILRYC